MWCSSTPGNHVVAVPEVYRGSVHSVVIRSAEVFREVVRSNAPPIIVVLNHPSGDPTPSEEDIRVTGQIIEAGKLPDIEILDHLVVAQNGFISLKEKDLGFELRPFPPSAAPPACCDVVAKRDQRGRGGLAAACIPPGLLSSSHGGNDSIPRHVRTLSTTFHTFNSCPSDHSVTPGSVCGNVE